MLVLEEAKSSYKESLEEIFAARKKGQNLRELAWKRLWDVGLPSSKQEEYRKLSLKSIYEEIHEEGESLEREDQIAGYTLIPCIDGEIEKVSLPGCVLSTLEEAFYTYGLFLQNRMHAKITRENDFFTLLPEALYDKGIFLYVPPYRKETLKLYFRHHIKGSLVFPRMQIIVGAGSEVEIISEMESLLTKEGKVHELIDITLEKGARLSWIDKASSLDSMHVMKQMRASLKKESFFSYLGLSRGSHFFRQKTEIELLEEGAEGIAKGVSQVGQNRVMHNYVEVQHKAPYTKSRQHFKGVLEENGKATFEGKIFVDKEAQKTEAYQLNNHLIIGDKASIHTKPNLEIFADDVKASHGATISQLSLEEIFYLQTRGLTSEKIGYYLTRGFLDALLKETIEDPVILERMRRLYAV